MSTRPYGFKVKDLTTGLYSAPGAKIGMGWTKIGRTWNTRSALQASITYWEEILPRWYKGNFHPENWAVVMMTEKGLFEFSFNDWRAAKGQKNLPEPINQPPKMTLTINEIDEVEEAMRNWIGDADEAGELCQRVSAILMQHMENTV